MTNEIPLSYVEYEGLYQDSKHLIGVGIGDLYEDVKSIRLDPDTKIVTINYLESFQDGTNENCYSPSPIKTTIARERISRMNYASEAELEHYRKQKEE